MEGVQAALLTVERCLCDRQESKELLDSIRLLGARKDEVVALGLGDDVRQLAASLVLMSRYNGTCDAALHLIQVFGNCPDLEYLAMCSKVCNDPNGQVSQAKSLARLSYSQDDLCCNLDCRVSGLIGHCCAAQRSDYLLAVLQILLDEQFCIHLTRQYFALGMCLAKSNILTVLRKYCSHSTETIIKLLANLSIALGLIWEQGNAARHCSDEGDAKLGFVKADNLVKRWYGAYRDRFRTTSGCSPYALGLDKLLEMLGKPIDPDLAQLCLCATHIEMIGLCSVSPGLDSFKLCADALSSLYVVERSSATVAAQWQWPLLCLLRFGVQAVKQVVETYKYERKHEVIAENLLSVALSMHASAELPLESLPLSKITRVLALQPFVKVVRLAQNIVHGTMWFPATEQETENLAIAAIKAAASSDSTHGFRPLFSTPAFFLVLVVALQLSATTETTIQMNSFGPATISTLFRRQIECYLATILAETPCEKDVASSAMQTTYYVDFFTSFALRFPSFHEANSAVGCQVVESLRSIVQAHEKVGAYHPGCQPLYAAVLFCAGSLGVVNLIESCNVRSIISEGCANDYMMYAAIYCAQRLYPKDCDLQFLCLNRLANLELKGQRKTIPKLVPCKLVPMQHPEPEITRTPWTDFFRRLGKGGGKKYNIPAGTILYGLSASGSLFLSIEI